MKPTLDQEKELLLLAAKAMGIEGTPETDEDGLVHIVLRRKSDTGRHFVYYWNPLHSAEQLNEMCAELDIDTVWSLSMHGTVYCASFKYDLCEANEHYSDHESKSKAAAWAALRVAGEIGRMK